MDPKVELETMVRQANLKTLKVQLLAATLSYHDLVQVVSTQPEWSWANNNAIMGSSRKAAEELEAIKASSAFWKDWVVQQDFMKVIRKAYVPDIVKKELQKAESLQRQIENLQLQVNMLKSMQTARRSFG